MPWYEISFTNHLMYNMRFITHNLKNYGSVFEQTLERQHTAQPHSGWSVTPHTPEQMEEIEERIVAPSHLSLRKLTSCIHGGRLLVHFMFHGLHLNPTASYLIKTWNHLITKKTMFWPVVSKHHSRWYARFQYYSFHRRSVGALRWVHKCPKFSIMVCRQPSCFLWNVGSNFKN